MDYDWPLFVVLLFLVALGSCFSGWDAGSAPLRELDKYGCEAFMKAREGKAAP